MTESANGRPSCGRPMSSRPGPDRASAYATAPGGFSTGDRRPSARPAPKARQSGQRGTARDTSRGTGPGSADHRGDHAYPRQRFRAGRGVPPVRGGRRRPRRRREPQRDDVAGDQGVTPGRREGGDQLAHVPERQGVTPLRAVHRDGGEFSGPLNRDVLKAHISSLRRSCLRRSPRRAGKPGRAGSRWARR